MDGKVICIPDDLPFLRLVDAATGAVAVLGLLSFERRTKWPRPVSYREARRRVDTPADMSAVGVRILGSISTSLLEDEGVLAKSSGPLGK
jgi:hypothetical protein